MTWIREKRSDFDRAVAYSGNALDEELVGDIEDAVESAIDWHSPDPLPETVLITGYRYMSIAADVDPENILTDIMERLEDEYGSDDREPFEPTLRMKRAAAALSEAIISDYQPWACESCGEAVVDVRAWCEANRPEWLKA